MQISGHIYLMWKRMQVIKPDIQEVTIRGH